MLKEFYKTAKKKNVRLVTPVPICDFDRDQNIDMKKNKTISYGCHIYLELNFVLDGNGDVLPCVHFSNYPHIQICIR
jgi:sulfatase maturation enzyme AslB (radical SAM superfamily)